MFPICDNMVKPVDLLTNPVLLYCAAKVVSVPCLYGNLPLKQLYKHVYSTFHPVISGPPLLLLRELIETDVHSIGVFLIGEIH